MSLKPFRVCDSLRFLTIKLNSFKMLQNVKPSIQQKVKQYFTAEILYQGITKTDFIY